MKRLSLLAASLPTAALAHPGDHAGARLWHLVTEPDHLAAIAAVVAIAAFVAYRRARS